MATIRFYEREGLLDAPPRGRSGYRQYPESAVQRIRFIRRSQELEFTLKEVAVLLGVLDNPNLACRRMTSCLADKIADVESRIEQLTEARESLRTLASKCDGRNRVDSCPILKELVRETDP